MTAFWDITLCCVVEVDQRFSGAYCLHYQGDEKAARRKASGTTGVDETRLKLGQTNG
jgi:hypothetical protein